MQGAVSEPSTSTVELLFNVQFKSGSNPTGLVQRAGFEPANRYGLGPHPSAFDQAGQPLRGIC